jgi:hypothetical protein
VRQRQFESAVPAHRQTGDKVIGADGGEREQVAGYSRDFLADELPVFAAVDHIRIKTEGS